MSPATSQGRGGQVAQQAVRGRGRRRRLSVEVPGNPHGPAWTQGLCPCVAFRASPGPTCPSQSSKPGTRMCLPRAQGRRSVTQHITWGQSPPWAIVNCTFPGVSPAGRAIWSHCGLRGGILRALLTRPCLGPLASTRTSSAQPPGLRPSVDSPGAPSQVPSAREARVHGPWEERSRHVDVSETAAQRRGRRSS